MAVKVNSSVISLLLLYAFCLSIVTAVIVLYRVEMF